MTNTTAEEPESQRFPPLLIALIAISLMVIMLGIAAWLYFRHARPIGAGPAGPTVPPDNFSTPWTQRPVVLLGLGDDATQGLGASPDHSYFQRLAKNPADEFPDMQAICLSKVLPHLQQVNLAISGTTSIECVEQQLPQLKPYPLETFGVVVITVGINDILHDFGRSPPRDGAVYGATLTEFSGVVDKYQERLETIIRRVRKTFPGGYQIYFAHLCDPTDGDGDIELTGLPAWPQWLYSIRSYNRMISLLVKHNLHVTVVDIRSAFIGHGTHCTHFWHRDYQKQDPHYWYSSDLASPNERGHDAIRRQFLAEMAQELPMLLR